MILLTPLLANNILEVWNRLHKNLTSGTGYPFGKYGYYLILFAKKVMYGVVHMVVTGPG